MQEELPQNLQLGDFPVGPVVKNLCFLAEDVGSIPSQELRSCDTTLQGQKINKSK